MLSNSISSPHHSSIKKEGYWKRSLPAALIELIYDVLSLERDHTIRRINIEQKIGDKVSAAGQYLYSNRDFSTDE